MKIKLKVEKEFDVHYLLAKVGARYWEDSLLNGVEDIDKKMPCIVDNYWCPLININTGVIINWKKGNVADIHYKCCDDGSYGLLDIDKNLITHREGYVPKILDLYKDSYGDYIIMKIDSDGMIRDWNNEASLDDFINDNKSE